MKTEWDDKREEERNKRKKDRQIEIRKNARNKKKEYKKITNE